MNTSENAVNSVTTLIADIVLLVSMLWRVMKMKNEGNLWRLLYHQGVVWTALATIAEVPTVTFLELNLKDPMNLEHRCYTTLQRFGNVRDSCCFGMSSSKHKWLFEFISKTGVTVSIRFVSPLNLQFLPGILSRTHTYTLPPTELLAFQASMREARQSSSEEFTLEISKRVVVEQEWVDVRITEVHMLAASQLAHEISLMVLQRPTNTGLRTVHSCHHVLYDSMLRQFGLVALVSVVVRTLPAGCLCIEICVAACHDDIQPVAIENPEDCILKNPAAQIRKPTGRRIPIGVLRVGVDSGTGMIRN
ncbi:hypothetical protein F5146DRAFT_1006464 [Armillaria mellea]|nr:hypothetical protein F5146DRAFT_1006464 [Armillaria mellea]